MFNSIYQRALVCYGKKAQIMKAIEELGELVTALSRRENNLTGDDPVISEIADVSVMIDQLSIIFGPDRVQAEKAKKLERLDFRIRSLECTA